MSLESILNHISDQAQAQKKNIIAEAQKQAQTILEDASRQADLIYKEMLAKADIECQAQRQRSLVNARLEHKKGTLQAKQEFIDAVFEELKLALKSAKIKKQQVYSDKMHEAEEDINFYLAQFRQDYESDIAQMLFS